MFVFMFICIYVYLYGLPLMRSLSDLQESPEAASRKVRRLFRSAKSKAEQNAREREFGGSYGRMGG